jgi:hypothetical protein
MIRQTFQYAFPVLLAACALTAIARGTGLYRRMGRAAPACALALSLPLVLLPVRGLSLADLVLSVNPVFSMGSIALLVTVLWRQAFGRDLIGGRDMLAFAAYNAVLSLCLYISYLGFVPYDIYALGYRFSALFAAVAALTIALLLTGSPLAYVFVSYIAAYNLGLLASANLFDYMTDGVLFLVSLSVLASRAFRHAPRRPADT